MLQSRFILFCILAQFNCGTVLLFMQDLDTSRKNDASVLLLLLGFTNHFGKPYVEISPGSLVLVAPTSSDPSTGSYLARVRNIPDSWYLNEFTFDLQVTGCSGYIGSLNGSGGLPATVSFTSGDLYSISMDLVGLGDGGGATQVCSLTHTITFSSGTDLQTGTNAGSISVTIPPMF
ncbi:hypothetical protein CH352_05300 [Leptospira hartskeerlii]|uniref:Uncharacterized protein n=1 Tax=Leptospira hartskeerlii TaxID=2023177 RepID=A0A2M9XFV1_9LEPT|nr:hypothetical protein [Leptospira hartskeerlii]PJZ26509.1 hypothetical protein CH357_03155 [Leptospira hartskeerlii]PJZ35008.1 hypothetical protein CH352_05300 [Leptospira hartskeerlii]